jgi:hypothetical protein
LQCDAPVRLMEKTIFGHGGEGLLQLQALRCCCLRP